MVINILLILIDVLIPLKQAELEEREERKKMQELREQERRQEDERERLLEQRQVTHSTHTSWQLAPPCVFIRVDAETVCWCLFRRRTSAEPKRSRTGGRRRST